jgi:hypothetical protein
MPKTGIANLPLHSGKAPRWLFKRMVQLSKGIIDVLLYEYGKDEVLQRISDPFWFQALSCVLGYDWHSSGTTTVTCGALKEAVDPETCGFAFAGGKGKTSRNTLSEIETIATAWNLSSATIDKLQYSSRMAAKIDNTALQDGHQLYHHVFVFSEDKKWSVIQQGMNKDTHYARRYHWCSEDLSSFICEPHNAIFGETTKEGVLDMTARQSSSCQKVSVDLVCDHPRHLRRDWGTLQKASSQQTLDSWRYPEQDMYSLDVLDMPKTINWAIMKELYDIQPRNYEELLSLRGVGPSTIRALALISELIYGEKPSWSDPVKYSFTVGGKDGVPYPVDRKAMDESAMVLHNGIAQASLGAKEKLYALRRLRAFLPSCNQ